MSLTKNIGVYVRLRPPVTANKQCLHVNSIGRDMVIKDKNDKQLRQYNFDKIFNIGATQEKVFNSIMKPIIEDTLKGFNCTVFAYGQTGTGKTFTIEGERSVEDISWDKDPKAGFIPRTVTELFDSLNSRNSEYSVQISFLEIFNEELIDRFSNNDNATKLKLFDDTVNKGSLVVSGLDLNK